MVIIRSWPCSKCTLILLCTTVNLKAFKSNNASGTSTETKKVRDDFKGGGISWTKSICTCDAPLKEMEGFEIGLIHEVSICHS